MNTDQCKHGVKYDETCRDCEDDERHSVTTKPKQSVDLLDVRSFKLGEASGKANERELCKRDVCMYCGGRAMGYDRTPEGPNESGNYVHRSKTDRRENDILLCLASSIFAREKFERTQQFSPTTTTNPTDCMIPGTRLRRTPQQILAYWRAKNITERNSQASCLRHGLLAQSKWHEGIADAGEQFADELEYLIIPRLNAAV